MWLGPRRSSSARKAERRSNGCVKRVVKDDGMALNDAFCFMNVTPKTKMARRERVAPFLFFRAWMRRSLNLVDNTLEVKFYPPFDWAEPSRAAPWEPALDLLNMLPLLSRRTAGALPHPQCSHVDGIG